MSSPISRSSPEKVSIKFFLLSETQIQEVFHDDSLSGNIPTPEQLQESDSTCKGMKTLCSLQFS